MRKIILLLVVAIYPVVSMAQTYKDNSVSAADSLKSCCDSLQYDLNALLPLRESETEKLLSKVDSLKNRCDSLQYDLDALLPLRAREAEKLLSKYGQYFNKRFSEIDETVADSLCKICQVLKVPSLDTLASEKDVTFQRKAKYDSLKTIVESPYNKTAVKNGIHLADSLSKVSPPFQASEFKSVLTAMNIYSTAISKTKEVVAFIHEMMEMYRPNGGHSGAVSTLNTILSNEKESSIDKYIKKVPYLKNLFEEMVADLRRDHLKQGNAEKILLKL